MTDYRPSYMLEAVAHVRKMSQTSFLHQSIEHLSDTLLVQIGFQYYTPISQFFDAMNIPIIENRYL